MGAAFGFWGPPDRGLLAAMAGNLRHRGRGAPIFVERPWGSIGYDPAPDNMPRLGALAGHWRDGEVDVVLAGDPSGFDGAQYRVEHPGAAGRAAFVEAWRTRGVEAFASLSPPWIAATLEPGRLTLARDPVGMRQLAWGRLGDRVLFASEPKGLWRLPGFPRRLHMPALAQYLACSFVFPPHTMLADVFVLGCGRALVLDDAGLREHGVFDFESIPEDPTIDEDTWCSRTADALAQACRERIPERGEIGLYLSGGLDSSIVAVELARAAPGRVHSFSIHFGAKLPNELGYARAVASHLGLEHHEVALRPRDFLPRFREVAWHLDDPIGDPITVPNFELSRRVAATTKLVFNGEGGDPVFGGPKNLPMMLSHWYGGVDHGPGSRKRAYLTSFRRAYDELDRLLTPEARAQIDPDRDLVAPLTPRLHADRPPTLLGKLQAANIRLKGAHLILPKVERMTAAAHVAIQSPLFDPRLVALSFAMPGAMKLRAGVEKWVLKRAYADALPPEVIARPKSGMRVPVHDWFLGEMRGHARALLSRRRVEQHGLWSYPRIAQILAYDREQPGGRYGLKLWMLVAFETWRALVLDGEAP